MNSLFLVLVPSVFSVARASLGRVSYVFWADRRSAQWGIGGVATKGFAGEPLAGSMLAQPRSKSPMNLKKCIKRKEKQMPNHKSRLHQLNSVRSTTSFTFASLLLSASLLQGCASSALEREKARNVLTRQSALLDALKSERAVPEVAKRINADATLAVAEVRLNAAIEALKKSNEAMDKSLSK